MLGASLCAHLPQPCCDFFLLTFILIDFLLNFEDDKTLGKLNFWEFYFQIFAKPTLFFFGQNEPKCVLSIVDTFWFKLDTFRICTDWNLKLGLETI